MLPPLSASQADKLITKTSLSAVQSAVQAVTNAPQFALLKPLAMQLVGIVQTALAQGPAGLWRKVSAFVTSVLPSVLVTVRKWLGNWVPSKLVRNALEQVALRLT